MGRQIGFSTAAPQPSPSNSTTTSSSITCSPEICAPPYCLQSCAATNNYYFLPPPAPISDSSNGKTSPLMIALISLLAAAFLLLAYYTFASKFCKRRRFRRSGSLYDESRQLQLRTDQLIPQDGTTSATQIAAVNSDGGLDEQFIKSITVFKFKRGDGLVESTDCAVCLTEFNEGESLRLMPNCQHAFHPPCIDTWLRTHASCPICRSSMVGPPPPPPRPQSAAPAAVLSRMRVERAGDVVLVVDAGVRDCIRVLGGRGEGDSGRWQAALAMSAAEGEAVGEKGRSNNRVTERVERDH